MAGSNQWVMGSDTTEVDAFIENDNGNAIVKIVRLTQPGLASIRATTDEQWQSIIDCIATAPEMVALLKNLRHMMGEGGYSEGSCVASWVRMIDAVLAKAEPPKRVKKRLLVTVEVEVEGEADASMEAFRNRAFDSVYTSAPAGVAFVSKVVTTLGELYEN